MADQNICSVNGNCIGCGVCVNINNKLFAMDGGHSKVIKQPVTSEEIASFNMAKSSCPVTAIVGEPKIANSL
ncbi:MAG: ferredoxin [candidate division SR1 bacterium CG_4_9_14_3_um_filter_40_9]|nr:MAG: ferredoxin [candidate division SR1 bacterium CG_4_9_14_3_um_filter_40_9]